MTELWKPIGNGKYEVSSLGNVRVAKTGRIMKPYTDKDQMYDRVDLYEDGVRTKRMVHSLVADAFIGPKPEGFEIDHLNTNVHDNRMSNLRYVDRKSNRSNPITLFNHEVARIRRAIASGKKSQEEILALIDAMKGVCRKK